VVDAEVDSDAEVDEHGLGHVGLHQSPQPLALTGEERRENLGLTLEPGPHRNADELVLALAALHAEEDRVRDMQIMQLINQLVVDVDFWLVLNHISIRNLLHVLQQHGVHSFVVGHPPNHLFLSQSEHLGVVVPCLGCQTLLEGFPVVLVDGLGGGEFVVVVVVFSEGVGKFSVDHAVCEEEFPFSDVYHLRMQVVFLGNLVNHIYLLQTDSIDQPHDANIAARLIRVLLNLLPLLDPSGLEVQAHLLQHHVLLLLGEVWVGVGPPVGQWELESVVGILEFEFDS